VHTRLSISALLLILAAALSTAGCGGDSGTTSSQTEPRLSKAQFTKKGNALCKKAVSEESEVFVKFSQEEERKSGNLAVSELEDFATDTILPIAQRMIEELSELRPPQSDQAAFDEVIAKFESGMEVAEETPSKFLSGEAFKAADDAADKYGLTDCGV
jgi:cobalamin biosynthesis protein CobT